MKKKWELTKRSETIFGKTVCEVMGLYFGPCLGGGGAILQPATRRPSKCCGLTLEQLSGLNRMQMCESRRSRSQKGHVIWPVRQESTDPRRGQRRWSWSRRRCKSQSFWAVPQTDLKAQTNGFNTPVKSKRRRSQSKSVTYPLLCCPPTAGTCSTSACPFPRPCQHIHINLLSFQTTIPKQRQKHQNSIKRLACSTREH